RVETAVRELHTKAVEPAAELLGGDALRPARPSQRHERAVAVERPPTARHFHNCRPRLRRRRDEGCVRLEVEAIGPRPEGRHACHDDDEQGDCPKPHSDSPYLPLTTTARALLPRGRKIPRRS